jgi:acetyl-CoA carboxylase biotin carboxylase subunit
MFERVLVANRGEIAVRVIRALQELSIEAIAVHSEADRDALHVRLADRAFEIGPAPATQSYLSVERLLEAALASGAQAIHPGYGFLSENAAFVRAVREAGLSFIGPPPEAMDAMGTKTAARKLMQASGVPIVPGCPSGDDETLTAAAPGVGFPLLVKAAAGGGGKGMRVVNRPEDLQAALEASRTEGARSFGSDEVYLERYLAKPRHIEVQVLCDRHGNGVHVLERECSIQRRHQKIIEECPSIALDADLRAQMGDAAVRAAQAVGYEGAGTVEFLLDADRSFYFLEMNTRLQVEHPVTEQVTGFDLVKAQLRIAAGEPLGFQQDQVVPRGHAIEARVYAEDPENNYAPSAGAVLAYEEPHGPFLRVDSGLAAGGEVSVHYDPLLAKVIATGETREIARRALALALERYAVLGPRTNIELLLDVLAHESFAAGSLHTGFMEEHFGSWRSRSSQGEIPKEVLVLAALAEHAGIATATAGGNEAAGPPEGDCFSPWRGAFAIGGAL